MGNFDNDGGLVYIYRFLFESFCLIKNISLSRIRVDKGKHPFPLPTEKTSEYFKVYPIQIHKKK